MRKEILTKKQTELLPLVKAFNKDFGLVGGTAIALHLGHRRSIDFDLFTDKEFHNKRIKRTIAKFYKSGKIIMDRTGEYTVIIKGVKITFFSFPFKIDFSEQLNHIVKLPDLLTLAAMKAYAMGRRPKWKDYVDLYFIIKYHFTIKDISRRADKIFGDEFNEKLFRTQLVYFEDINYSEKIIYLKGFETADKHIKKCLIDFSLQ